METVSVIAATMGVAWASGINLYAAIFVLGWMGSAGTFDLPPDLEILANPLVMGAAAVMYCVEFFTDKIPGVDTAWDALHTFIRIPAGAMLAAGAISPLGGGAELAALILGGTLTAGTHATKAGSRVLINTSPEPFTNWSASIGEDIAVIGGLWMALNHPVLFIIALVLVILLMIWLLPKIWRGIVAVFRKIANFLGGDRTPAPEHPGPRGDRNPK